MSIVLSVLKLAAVLVVGFLFTAKVIPWVYVKIARALGFRARMTPITARRIARFKRIKRGYWAFMGISTLFVVSLFLEVLVNGRAIVIHFDGKTSFPAVAELADNAIFFTDISSFQRQRDFGQGGEREVDYRKFARWSDDIEALRADVQTNRESAAQLRSDVEAQAPAADAGAFETRKHARRVKKADSADAKVESLETTLQVFERGDAWIVMPLYPYAPGDLRLDLSKNPPNAPSSADGVILGTDMSGRDIVPLMLYGFRISLAFALLVASCGYSIGVVVGGMQGYFGGWIDILSQRFVEIWGSIPFLFTMMILASLVTPTFGMLVILLVVLRSWLGITYFVRGEFYREKSKDYVQAAIGAGVSDWKIIIKHILPNSIVPIVTFAPFGIVAYIGSLVSLDYLGFGLPSGTPSWGALLRQGLENVKHYPHLVIIPTCALASTLYAVVMVGEAVREAFDPKVFSRLR